MTVAEITKEMIVFSEGNKHDIDHFLRVWSYAKTIGELEGLDAHTQFILEAAALLHDIACPLCREKYGNTNGKVQETEGAPMAYDFLVTRGADEETAKRVAYLVGRHHTYKDADGADLQILWEADYIANAFENGYSAENVRNFTEKVVKTASARALIAAVFGG